MRGIRMRFEEQPGLCRKTRRDSRRHPPRPGEAPGSRLRLLNAHDLLRDA